MRYSFNKKLRVELEHSVKFSLYLAEPRRLSRGVSRECNIAVAVEPKEQLYE
jgi:hypothetical protein